MKKAKTKADELRDASKILWHGGIALSTIYVKSAMPELPNWTLVPIYIVCMLLQYALTKIETAVFSGSIPHPWHENASTKTNYIWVGAMFMLLMDVVINLGGVGTVANFLKKSATGDVLKNNFGANETALSIITGLMIIALAFLFAVGSELLKMYAETLEIPADEKLKFKESKQTKESEQITEKRNEKFINQYEARKQAQEEQLKRLSIDPELSQQLETAKARANFNAPNKRKP